MSTNPVDNKPGESWTVLANENDVTYSLPIFLGIGGQIIISRITELIIEFLNSDIGNSSYSFPLE